MIQPFQNSNDNRVNELTIAFEPFMYLFILINDSKKEKTTPEDTSAAFSITMKI